MKYYVNKIINHKADIIIALIYVSRFIFKFTIYLVIKIFESNIAFTSIMESYY